MKAHILEIAQFLNVKPGLILTALYANNRNNFYTVKKIPKRRKGETRTIHAVSGRLRTLQRKTYEALSPMYRPKNSATGFVKGGGIVVNAKKHRNKKIVICYDIKDFFPSITFARVKGMFRKYPFDFSEDQSIVYAQICCLPEENGSLPQGGITSPYISNMICRKMDARLQGYAVQNNLKYTRYSDDLTFSTNDSVDEKSITKDITKIIEEEGFELNRDKSRLLTKSNRQSVTGIIVNEGLNVNRKYIRSVRAILHNCSKYGVLSQIKEVRESNPWDSCLPIKTDENGNFIYYKDNSPISIKAAKDLFFDHLRGRIQFIGQVAKGNKDLNKDHYNNRVRIYNTLVDLYEQVRTKEKIIGQRKILAKIVRESTQDVDLINAINGYNIEQLDEFVLNMRKNDVRFFTTSFPEGDIDHYRRKVGDYLKFPASDPNKVNEYFKKLKDSDTVLGMMVHNRDIQANDLRKFMNEFEQHKIYLPRGMQHTFSDFLSKISEKYQFDNKNDTVNPYSNKNFRKEVINPFKSNTRFSNLTENQEPEKSLFKKFLFNVFKPKTRDGIITNDETDLVKLVKGEFEGVSEDKKLFLDFGNLRPYAFYTDVNSFRNAIRQIATSMIDNSQGKKIICRSGYSRKDKTVTVEIHDDNSSQLELTPSRDFLAKGKLLKAVASLNALCDYSISANFQDSGWMQINMFEEKITKSEPLAGFAHKLVFKL